MADTSVYLSGERIQGRSDDEVITAVAQTSWKELSRTTLGSTSSTITSSFADKDNIMVLISWSRDSGTNDPPLQLGDSSADTGNNYARRRSANGAEDSVATGIDYISQWSTGTGSGVMNFQAIQFRNVAGQEKLGIEHGVFAGATGQNAPNRVENAFKWANTSDQAGYISYGGGNTVFSAGSEIVVLGCDDDEADSGTNFWQELASADLSGGAADVISTGTFTAKKYLWVTGFAEESGSSITGNVKFNNDGGGNYCRRRESNGATDSTATGETSIDVFGGETESRFHDFLVVNISGKEKVVTGDIIGGASGASNAPRRVEFVAKWINTSAQITRVDLINTDPGGGGENRYGTKTSIRVWGSD